MGPSVPYFPPYQTLLEDDFAENKVRDMVRAGLGAGLFRGPTATATATGGRARVFPRVGALAASREADGRRRQGQQRPPPRAAFEDGA